MLFPLCRPASRKQRPILVFIASIVSIAIGSGWLAPVTTMGGVIKYSVVDLGDLPGGSDSSVAQGINRFGQVVGYSSTQIGNRAFLWDSAGGIQDLNLLLDASATGWTLYQARSINDSGQIVGLGLNPDGKNRAFLLNPNFSATAVPEPMSWASFALIALGAGTTRRRRVEKQATV